MPRALPRGKVLRTADLAAWGKNTPRTAARLVKAGKLVRLRKGLFACPSPSRFGNVPPADEELLRSFVKGSPFIVTGPERWNALGLGSTSVFASPLVYNTKRSGTFELGGKRFMLRRVPFPRKPSAEWFVVDLFENVSKAGITLADASKALARAMENRRFDRERLIEMAAAYGTRRTRAAIAQALE